MTPHGGSASFSSQRRESRPALPPTPRQLECLAEYALHGDRHEAAACLGMPRHTFKNRLHDLYQRLDVTRFPEALAAVGWIAVPAEYQS